MRDWHKEAKKLERERNKALWAAETARRKIELQQQTIDRLRRELKTTVRRLERFLRANRDGSERKL